LLRCEIAEEKKVDDNDGCSRLYMRKPPRCKLNAGIFVPISNVGLVWPKVPLRRDTHAARRLSTCNLENDIGKGKPPGF